MLKIKYLLPLILILLLTFTLVSDCADLFGTYDQRIKLTIDNTKIDSDLTWFPVMIKLTNAQMEEVFAEFDSDDDFDRCAITLADESTQIYGDCERFDDSGEVAEYHAAKTGVVTDADAAGYLYFYYDKDAAHNTTYISMSGGTAAQSVYDANFNAVYHMNDISDANIEYDTKYEAAVEPDSDGWTLVETDYASSDGDILTIDTSANDNLLGSYRKTPDVDFDAGFYLKTRIKASTDMNTQDDYLHFSILDGTQNEKMMFGISNAGFYSTNSSGSFGWTALDTTTSYVVYELYVKGTSYWLYADGVLKDTDLRYTQVGTDLVQFGDISPGIMCKAEIDYVYYALDIGWNPAITDIVDSTSNNNAGTKKGAGEPAEATGKAGQGQDFDGSDDSITFPCTALSTTDYTIEAVFQAETNNLNHFAPTHEVVDATTQYDFPRVSAIYASDYIYIQRDASGSYTIPWTADDDWTHLAWIRTSGTISGYIDGASKTVSTSGSDYSQSGYDFTGTEFWVSKFHYSGTYYYYTGLLDEYRISNSARAAAWIKATKESLWDSLLTYGSEETSGVVTTNILFTFTNF